MTRNTTANSSFTKWRELFKPVADFPLENLILAETNQSRTSPLREAGGTLAVTIKKISVKFDIIPKLGIFVF